MKSYETDEFVWFTRTIKSPYAISISNREQLNINPKLQEQLPATFEIGV